MKQFPKLSLVTNGDQLSEEGGGDKPSAGFELISIDDLAPAQRALVQRQVSEVSPKSSIIAVARTPRDWDLRPVITRTGENDPSIIRFAGPDIQNAQHLQGRVRETLERLKGLRDLSSSLLAWGNFQGQIWYRRPLVERTLAHTLSSPEEFGAEETFSVARGLVEELNKWHQRGIVHSHITSSNISVQQNGRVALLDAAMGLALLQSSQGVMHANLQSFAPELLNGQSVVFGADLYGLGLIYRRMFVALNSKFQLEKNPQQYENLINPLLDMSNALLDVDPSRRPALNQVRNTIISATNRYRDKFVSPKQKQSKPKIGPSIAQGRIVRHGGDQRNVELESEQFEAPREEVPAPQSSRRPEIRTQSAPTAPEFRRGEPADIQQPGYGYAPHPQQLAGQPGGYSGGPHVQTAIYQAMSAQQIPAQQIPQQQIPVQQIPVQTYQNQPMMQPQQAQQQPMQQPVHQQQQQQQIAPQQMLPMSQPYYYQQQPVYSPQTGYVSGPVTQPNYGQDPNFNSIPTQQMMPMKKSVAGAWYWMFGALLLAAFWYYRIHGLEDLPIVGSRQNTEQLREDWNSRIPSRMLGVALAAVSSDSRAAEGVIVSSVRTSDLAGTGVNTNLIQVAFNDAWEVELSRDDRRAALILALGGLLKQNVPTDLPSLDSLHPGVILALASSVGQSVGKNYFANIPASRLAELPPPYGPAFKILLEAHPGLTCADEGVQRLARLGTRSKLNIEEVALYLRDDTTLRLRALGMMFSQDNAKAQSTLENLTSDSSLVSPDDNIKWARAFKLIDWKELEASDRLFLLTGVPPAGGVSTENIGKLFAHPVPAIRAYALSKAFGAIKMKHPGSLEVLQIVQHNPSMLTAGQTIDLIKILVSPDTQDVTAVRSWLESKPPKEIVVPLLLATRSASKGTTLDTALAVYLQGIHWKPGIENLRTLSTHPDSYTRLYAYSEIFLMEDRAAAKELLSAALGKEHDDKNHQQLQQMLLDLAH